MRFRLILIPALLLLAVCGVGCDEPPPWATPVQLTGDCALGLQPVGPGC